jgi:hypothetical protein
MLDSLCAPTAEPVQEERPTFIIEGPDGVISFAEVCLGMGSPHSQ